MTSIATFTILNPDIVNPHITDKNGVPLELYSMILDPKREKLAELYKQCAELQAEVDQLEATLEARSTNIA